MSQKYHLYLKGFVGGYDFDRDYVDYVLGKYAGKQVNVLIDSLGGSVATALSIASAFKNHGDVSVHFVGMNASAATIASLGAKNISIDTNAMYLVHKCSMEVFKWADMNADQLVQLIADCEKSKADLDKLDGNIASMYAAKCKKDKNDLLELMKAGGWLTARETKEWGFVDEITEHADDAAPSMTDAVASAMAAVGMPIPNIPVASRDSAFAKFLSSFAHVFKPKSQTDMNQETENQTQPLVDAKRIADLEASVADKEKTIEDLRKQVADLKTEPAASTTTVIEDSKGQPESGHSDSPLSQFCNDAAEARKMYDLLH